MYIIIASQTRPDSSKIQCHIDSKQHLWEFAVLAKCWDATPVRALAVQFPCLVLPNVSWNSNSSVPRATFFFFTIYHTNQTKTDAFFDILCRYSPTASSSSSSLPWWVFSLLTFLHTTFAVALLTVSSRWCQHDISYLGGEHCLFVDFTSGLCEWCFNYCNHLTRQHVFLKVPDNTRNVPNPEFESILICGIRYTIHKFKQLLRRSQLFCHYLL